MRALMRPVQRLCVAMPARMLSAAPERAAAKPSRKRERPPAITMTDRAAQRIQELLERKPDAIGVRIGVKKRGCNGLSYTMNYTETVPEKDEEISHNGVRLFIDPAATFFVVGTVMDYEDTPLSSEFTFKNPNAKGSCGCGESFNV